MDNTKKPQQEDFYEVFINKDGEIMFAVTARDNAPQDPRILYDGGEHALFYRTPENAVILDFLHPEVRKPLSDTENVLVSEVRESDVLREYTVPIRIVKALPIAPGTVKPLPDTGR